ncbi:TetR/AcrR family transcriptional regulator [Glycomyces harbinensis]|uniref:Transcriptional regulator, TetR family n=1 Tax=Glycomyces harbinensis TaxID=58114 RepID=A0A1G6XD21_9ACTN|nr:TetR/AcrR family transcriptional regulator [Glycomyces harbinensis]SDD75683.1 transcriptional regulator, TetR family [Glycomyces harbinensis]
MERRSRLGPEREAEIFAAVERLVREHGYEKVTMQQIAAEARTSTATLYRRWDGKPRLVVEAIRHRRPAPLEAVDTGSLRGDLLAGVRAVVDSTPEDHELMSGLANAARSDEELDRAQREVLAEPMRRAVDAVLDRAAARGEIASDAPAREFVPELLFASTVVHRIHTGSFPDEAYLVRFIDVVLLPALGVRKP